MKQIRWFKEQLRESGMKTKWMRFIVLWLLPFCIAIDILLLIRNVVQQTITFRMTGHVDWAFVALDVYCMVIVTVATLTFWFSVQLLQKGYRFIIVIFILEIVSRIVQPFVLGYWEAGTTILLFGIIFWIVNIVYFSKRKQLFCYTQSAE